MEGVTGSPLRVAIVNKHPADGPGGSEIQCDLLARGLVARGHDVVYVAPHRAHRPPPSRDVAAGYAVVRVPQWGRSIARVVVDAGVDVVYWRFNTRGLRIGARRIARAGVPIVFAVSHVNDLAAWSSKPVGGRRLRRALAAPVMRVASRWQHPGLRHVAAMTTNNPDLVERLTASTKVHVANGMVADAVPFDWPRPFCLWVSGLKASKRPQAVVRLAGEIGDLGVDVVLVGGVQERGHERIVEGWGLPANMHYLGTRRLEEVNGMFAAARLHVHTCLPEGFPNVFIQAWLQGCPSVSLGFDPGGVITSERLGADAGDDWDTFVGEVRRLLTDDAERDAAGARARVFAKGEFGVDTMVDRVEHLLVSSARPTSRT